jgi:hypothetical protein
MPVTAPNAEEVRIMNSENNTHYFFTLRKDRLAAFYQYMLENRNAGKPALPASVMPGISGPAIYGLDCIFFGPKPSKFPPMDIFVWIRNQQKAYLGDYPNPTITTQEVEAAIEQWAGTVTQLLADGSDRA